MCRAPTDPGSALQTGEAARAAPMLLVCRDVASMRSPAASGNDAVVRISHDPVDQQSTPFALVALGSCLLGAPAEVLRAAAHQAVQHLEPGGRMVVGAELWPAVSRLCEELGLIEDAHAAAGDTMVVRRTERLTVHDLVWEARARIRRVDPVDLAAELTGATPPLVLDTRTHTDRCRTGVIAGSVHVPRTVLEWHLDPANGYRHAAVTGFDQPLVVVCNGGYSSSLAAANLVRIGFGDVRDLAGGMRAWTHRGLPVEQPDHAHLDL